MAATESGRRIDLLARPKAFHPNFLEDRRSVYWVDRYPQQPGPDGITAFKLTPRLGELCQAKNVHASYIGHRPSPMWAVSDGARNAEASARVSQLADFRPVHRDYVYERSVYTRVTDAARSAEPSGRLQQLSEPKPHKIWANSNDTIIEGHFNTPITEVTSAARDARCSDRLETLSSPKYQHPHFLGERPVMWPIPQSAKNANATLRLQQLARPKSRGSMSNDYDPYYVSLGARVARPTPRVCELATPLPRKVRQKKIDEEEILL